MTYSYNLTNPYDRAALFYSGNTTEFWVPDFKTVAIVDLEVDN